MTWKSTLATVAPTIATALGGPLAGTATKFLADYFTDGDTKTTQEQLENAITNASPAQLTELKKLDLDFKQQMKQLNVDLEKINAQDRDSARKREIKTGSWANPTLAAIVIAGFFATVGYVLATGFKIDENSAALIGTLIGYVSAKADQVVSYYFGSSAGSKEKNALMAKNGKL